MNIVRVPVAPGVPQTLVTKNIDPAKDQRYLNPDAFQVPAPSTFGNVPSVTGLRGFASSNENLELMKRTYITETVNVEFRFEMFKAFNRHRFNGIRTFVSDPFNFGRVSGASGNREGQFRLEDQLLTPQVGVRSAVRAFGY